MIKTTNYEISKKLAEIGFKAKAEKCWAKIKHSVQHPSLSEFNLVNLDFAVPQNCDEWVLSHDLETLLDALPDTIGGRLMIHKEGMYYQEYMVEVQKQKNESLADTAGRLIINLYENNLIKF